MKPLPDSALLHQYFSYDPETGRLLWKASPSPKARIVLGSDAGVTVASGHREVKILGVRYMAHRIVWKMMTGEDPTDFIDHINNDPLDNRWRNLRTATLAENSRNSRHRMNSASPLKGATFNTRDKRWVAQITVNRTYRYLGMFRTAEEAHEAYKRAAKKLHGEFARAA